MKRRFCFLCLLSTLSLILVSSCSKREEEIDFTTAPVEESERSLSVPMMEVLPGNAVPEWKLHGAPEYYDRHNLYEYMDGGAERYLSAGFEGLITCVYTINPGEKEVSGGGENREVRAEVYRLTSQTNARSLFALERTPGFQDFPAGEKGALGRLTLLFYREEFYVKLMAYTESEATREALKKLAAGIDKRILEIKEDEGS